MESTETVAEPTVPPTGRRRSAKSHATRAAILDAALEVFSTDGYRTGSLNEIARRVDITEPGVLHHFGSKPRLLAAVLERRDELARERLRRAAPDGVEVLRLVLDIARHDASEPGVLELYCMLAAEASTPGHAAHGYFTTRYADGRARIEHAFSDLESRGLLREGITPVFAARATLAFMDGLKVQWLLDRTVLDMSDDIRTFFTTITRVEF